MTLAVKELNVIFSTCSISYKSQMFRIRAVYFWRKYEKLYKFSRSELVHKKYVLVAPFSDFT